MHTPDAPIPILWVTPFVLLLLAIATLPLAAGKFWARRYPLVCVGLSLPVVAYFTICNPHRLGETALDYASFMILLGSLYVVSSGIFLEGGMSSTPLGNTLYLATGALVSNVIGTTGASMLLVRPLIRANRHRGRSAAHVFVFFIFVVSNIGGSLTPLGDPPLFLGYLEGVPFTWTLRLWPMWLTTVTIVLAIFFLIECYATPVSAGEPASEPADPGSEPTAGTAANGALVLQGKRNLWFLAGIVGCIFLDRPLREAGMVAMAILSYQITPEAVHDRNEFTLSPIREVAILFAGIFATMLPALVVLEQRSRTLGVDQPWEFFWMTGALSSFLDNAPTYLTFLSAGRGLGLGAEVVGVPAAILAAISCGAVFMGANSYIGNGPNFMVKAIVEENGIEMPGFFGYMLYSSLVLIPTFLIVTLIFFA
jgi:Na+/H+ antiporter NhaD/arsenite permease-like protein